ncbi:MAG: hypothetical protein ACKVW3_14385 [Phycisphaerales bacterium]
MGKRSKRRKLKRTPTSGSNKHRARPQPDNFLSHGPIEMARFGKRIVIQNAMSPAEHAEYSARAAADYPAICREVTKCVRDALDVVRLVSPLELLRWGYWECIAAFHKIGPEESGHGPEQLVARQLVVYVQKLIVAAGPSGEAPAPTELQLESLRTAVAQLYDLFTGPYYLSRSAYLRQLPDYDSALDEFSVHTEGLWMLVAGDRHAHHDAAHMESLLLAHDASLREVFGIGVTEIVQGVQAIRHTLAFGVNDSLDTLKVAHVEFQKLVKQEPATDLGELLGRVRRGHSDDPVLGNAMDCLFGYGLFDVARITTWPRVFIESLAAAPGTDHQFVSHRDRGGWPTQSSVCAIKPFLFINGSGYVFDQAHCLDVLYRAIEHAVFEARPRLAETWNRRQKETSEALALELLSSRLPKARVLHSVCYKSVNADSDAPQSAECDGLILYDNHLIIVEVKAGRLSRKSPAIHPQAHLNSLKSLIRDPIEQGRRFLQELRANGRLALFTLDKKFIDEITDTFDSVTIACVTLDQLSDHAPMIEHLSHVGVSRGTDPVWPVSIDDLRVITDILRTPIQFMHFVQERLRAFASPHVRMADELDHLGAYLVHSAYVYYAGKIGGEATSLAWHGYRDAIDRYYHDLLVGNTAVLPSQALPQEIHAINECLASQAKPGHVSAGKWLLNGSSDARADFVAMIHESRRKQRTRGRAQPFSTTGGFRVSLVVNEDGGVGMAWERSREYGCAALQLEREPARLLLALTYSVNGTLSDVSFEIITPATACALGENRLRPVRQRLFQSRLRVNRQRPRRNG